MYLDIIKMFCINYLTAVLQDDIVIIFLLSYNCFCVLVPSAGTERNNNNLPACCGVVVKSSACSQRSVHLFSLFTNQCKIAISELPLIAYNIICIDPVHLSD